jgi:hypothetical protein
MRYSSEAINYQINLLMYEIGPNAFTNSDGVHVVPTAKAVGSGSDIRAGDEAVYFRGKTVDQDELEQGTGPVLCDSSMMSLQPPLTVSLTGTS